MKSFTLFLSTIILGGLLYSFSPQEKKMPVTTTSETALKLYYEAWDAVFDYRLNKARQLWSDALQADSEFFMANYMLANFNSSDSIKYKQYSEKATNCNAKLSKGELLIKDAFTKILENPKSDVTDLGKKLVELYPKDVFTYTLYSGYQGRINDVDGQIETLNNAIKVAEKPDIIYNTLGYVYMRDGRYKEAETAFDKYIELAPEHPNPYDSKGEYFVTIKDYQSASESYMKAYELDSKEWRLDRAIKAELEVLRIGHKEAVDSKNIENILQFYSKDMITLANGEPIVYGNEWIKPLLKELYASYDFHEDFNYTDIRVYDENLVASTYSFTQTMTSLTSGETVKETGIGMCILKRNENGKWQFEWNAYTLN